MATNKLWNVKFIAGNPEMYDNVRTEAGSPYRRSEALEIAETINGNGWRGWVEHAETGKRIYETQAEREYAARS